MNDILNMQAGRELDALVAEKVMGWDVETFKKQNGWWVREDREVDAYKPFRPSIDIVAAWEVVEKLNGELSFSIRRLGSYFNEGKDWEGWEAGFTSYPDRIAKAKTAPHAICLAAILALEGNRGD